MNALHRFMDKLDVLLNPKPRPQKLPPPITTPVIRQDPNFILYKTLFRNADVSLSFVYMLFTTIMLLVAPGGATISDLIFISITSMSRRGAAERKVSFPRMVSADLVLILLSYMSVNAFALAVLRVVESEHKKEVQKRILDELNEAYDVDPEKIAAYAAKSEEKRKKDAERRTPLLAENEKRKKEGKRGKRDVIIVSEIVEADSATDALVPIVVTWPMILGTVVVLLGANAVRGVGAAVMMVEMCVAVVLPKITNGILSAQHVLQFLQTLAMLLMGALIAMQCYVD